MAKNTTKHELISHEPSRRATLKKRKASFFRKLDEITTLCGVIACAVIYNTSDTKVDVWPSHRKHFMQGKFMVDQESFLKNNISKLNRQLEKERFKNQELDEKLLLIEYLELEGKNFLDPGRLESLIRLRIEFFEGVGRNQVDAGVDSDEMVAILVSGGVVIQPIQNKLCEHRA
ncbi:MADS-box transcription factor PHERES 2-like [Pyrus ussuriensis x Pyrus communis]|uniref:MADS-box transcription factor PHERES 2-like n=1 Tax=Pyrus ussuriensis x Pyrus communis TaxID=2448454 RepID=A0A5N5GUM8_9ROSA|nr:MADS-box transcription factor PHERES 2-like [Pyrus ussuriensis x Pyrus communis]